ncbi:MAG: hypothetical protein M3Z66_02705 [Chloroflexota bacterium]|nr:hypothetical protein [Chloroflexota bacterium]
MIIVHQMRDRELAGNHPLEMLPNTPYDPVREVESMLRLRLRRCEWATRVPEERRVRIECLRSGQETGKAGLKGLALRLELDKIVRVLKRNGMGREERLHRLLRSLLRMVCTHLR